MRYFILRASVVLSLAVGAGLAVASTLGPVASRTGAPAFGGRPGELVCTACHNQIPQINHPSGSLRVLGVPAHYTPGQLYPITVQLSHDRPTPSSNPLHWGFQLQACKASNGDSAGIWVLGANTPPDTFRVISTSTTTGNYRRRQYVEHTRRNDPDQPEMGSIRHGQNSPATWTVNWRAPLTDVGTVYFFAAGNAANGDWTNGMGLAPSDTGDYIFTTAESTLAPLPVGVEPGAPGAVTTLEEPFPNPARRATSIEFTITRGGILDLAVYDLQGRFVKSLVHEYRAAGRGSATWEGREESGAFARNGIYFVKMIAPGEKRPLMKKVALTR